MDEMTAFERQIAGELSRMAGPGRRIDATAMVHAVASQASRWPALTRRVRGGSSPTPEPGSGRPLRPQPLREPPGPPNGPPVSVRRPDPGPSANRDRPGHAGPPRRRSARTATPSGSMPHDAACRCRQ